MQIKVHFSGMAVVASLLIILASGCASFIEFGTARRNKPYEERRGNARRIVSTCATGSQEYTKSRQSVDV